jgi:PAS domain S-box-containing protein
MKRRRNADSVSRLTSIIESAPTAMVMVDREGRVVLLNCEAESLFGYPREELFGESVELLLP